MSAQIIGVKESGSFGGKPIYEPTGETFGTYASVNDWIAEKQKASIAVQSVNGKILIPSVPNWSAFEETKGDHSFMTVFQIEAGEA